MIPCALGGFPPGRKAWSMMVHGICIKNKKEIAFIRHEDAQAFPADSFGNAAYELLCANVFHDMEIRYVDIFASNRYAALKVPGNPGSRMLGRKRRSRRGLVRRALLLRTRAF